MKQHLICMDIDGTLLDSNQQISPNTIQLIQELQQEGHLFYVATGRMYLSAVETAQRISPETAALASNGGIFSIAGMVEKHPFPNEEALAIYTIAKAYRLPLFFFSHDTVFYSEFLPDYFVDKGDQGRVASGAQQSFQPIQTKEEFLQYATDFISGIIISEDDAVGLKKAKAELQQIHQLYVSSSFPNNIELMPQGVNKATAIKAIQAHFKIAASETLAFGDGENDLEMLQAAGIGVAMGNAVAAIKNVATATTTSNNEDGIYHFLKDYFRNGV